MNLDSLLGALKELNDSSAAAQRFGPFFFALLLLIFAPIIATSIFKRYSDKIGDEQTKALLLSQYSRYFYICLYIGATCTVAGVMWWFYENWRQDQLVDQSIKTLKTKIGKLESNAANMRYATVGTIEDATDLKSDFINTLGRPAVVFSREAGPQQKDSDPKTIWLFAVISDQPILASQPIPVVLTYTPPGGGEPIFWHLNFPVQASATPLVYRFTVDDSGAHIAPQE